MKWILISLLFLVRHFMQLIKAVSNSLRKAQKQL